MISDFSRDRHSEDPGQDALHIKTPLVANYLAVPSLADFREDLAGCWGDNIELIVAEFASILVNSWSDPSSDIGASLRASILRATDDRVGGVTDISTFDIATSHIRNVMVRIAVAMEPLFAGEAISVPCAEMLIALIVRSANFAWAGCGGEIVLPSDSLLEDQSIFDSSLFTCTAPPGYRFLAVTEDIIAQRLVEIRPSTSTTALATAAHILAHGLGLTSGFDPALIAIVCHRQVGPGQGSGAS